MKMSTENWCSDTERASRSTGSKTCPSDTSSITNLTWTGLGSNPGLCNERPATNRLSQGVARQFYVHLNDTGTFSYYLTVNPLHFLYKARLVNAFHSMNVHNIYRTYEQNVF
jgi:hypothetical protein